jgi:hypothetical protein
MPQAATLRVRGYSGFLAATARADRESKRYVRETFRQVGDVVRQEAAGRFASTDIRSAAGYRTRVRQRGIVVEQSLGRTTGTRPDFGALQMRRALLPALMSNADTLDRGMERALDRVADHFDQQGALI